MHEVLSCSVGKISLIWASFGVYYLSENRVEFKVVVMFVVELWVLQ